MLHLMFQLTQRINQYQEVVHLQKEIIEDAIHQSRSFEEAYHAIDEMEGEGMIEVESYRIVFDESHTLLTVEE